MKKLIALLLLVTVMFSTIPAFAATEAEVKVDTRFEEALLLVSMI